MLVLCQKLHIWTHYWYFFSGDRPICGDPWLPTVSQGGGARTVPELSRAESKHNFGHKILDTASHWSSMLFSNYKQLKSDFVEPFLLPGSFQILFLKIDFMNNTVSFKDLFDLYVVFMQNAFEIWRHHLLMFHACETFCQALLQSAHQIDNKYNACCCSRRLWTASIFLSFIALLQLILFSNLSRLVLLNNLHWTPLSIS